MTEFSGPSLYRGSHFVTSLFRGFIYLAKPLCGFRLSRVIFGTELPR